MGISEYTDEGLELRGQVRAGALDLSLEKVVAKIVLFVSPSGHVGPPYFHCPEGVPAPGKEDRPDVVRPSTPGPLSHLIEEHRQKQSVFTQAF